MTTVNIKAKNVEGYEVLFQTDFPDGYNSLMGTILSDPDMGFKPVLGYVSAPVQVATGGAPAVTSGDYPCQFCGNQVTDLMDFKDKSKVKMTAKELSESRAIKMIKMGRGEGKPVCGKCWSAGGHKAAAEAAYQAGQK